MKTEPCYLKDFIRYYKFGTANFQVLGKGCGPLSVVEAAIKSATEERKTGEHFDKVYCIFDRNSHDNFDAASELALKNEICLARSWPCFEYWLLLHFEFKRQPYATRIGKSASQNCISDLKKHIAYKKGSEDLFKQLLPKLDTAKKNAEKALMDAEKRERAIRQRSFINWLIICNQLKKLIFKIISKLLYLNGLRKKFNKL